MKALILDGTKSTNNESTKIFDLMVEELTKLNWEVISIGLEDKVIGYCTGCFGCWVQTPGECVIKDYEENIVKDMVHSDLIIYLTPIMFGGYSSILKKALDRQIGRVLPYFTKVDGEVHHSKRYEKQQSLLSIGLLDKHDTEKEYIFKTLVTRNAINMWAPFQRAIISLKGEDLSEFSNNFNNALMEVEAIL